MSVLRDGGQTQVGEVGLKNPEGAEGKDKWKEGKRESPSVEQQGNLVEVGEEAVKNLERDETVEDER